MNSEFEVGAQLCFICNIEWHVKEIMEMGVLFTYLWNGVQLTNAIAQYVFKRSHTCQSCFVLNHN